MQTVELTVRLAELLQMLPVAGRPKANVSNCVLTAQPATTELAIQAAGTLPKAELMGTSGWTSAGGCAMQSNAAPQTNRSFPVVSRVTRPPKLGLNAALLTLLMMNDRVTSPKFCRVIPGGATPPMAEVAVPEVLPGLLQPPVPSVAPAIVVTRTSSTPPMFEDARSTWYVVPSAARKICCWS